MARVIIEISADELACRAREYSELGRALSEAGHTVRQRHRDVGWSAPRQDGDAAVVLLDPVDDEVLELISRIATREIGRRRPGEQTVPPHVVVLYDPNDVEVCRIAVGQ